MVYKLKRMLICLMAVVLLVVYCSTGEVKADDMKIVPDDVFSVVLPTLRARNDTTFGFIMDPQGLITATGAARYGGIEFEEGQTVYFQNSESEYKGNSISLMIENYSTTDVDVEVTATIQNCEEFKMSDDRYFGAEYQDAMLYLALADDEGQESAIGSDGSAILTTTLKAADNAYEVVCRDGAYEYVLKENYEEDSIDKYSFWMTGACNENADWTGLEQANPMVVVVWTVTKCTDTDNVSLPEFPETEVVSGSAIDIE